MSIRLALVASLLAAIYTPVAAQQQPQQQPAADQPLDRGTFIQRMDAEFGALDADGNGQVTAQEAMNAQRQQTYNQAMRQNQAAFQQLDRDGNGVLTAEEFAGLVNPQAIPADPAPLMQAFDANGDGIITLVEYRVRTQANFDAVDSDRDGVVTNSEMQAAGIVVN